MPNLLTIKIPIILILLQSTVVLTISSSEDAVETSFMTDSSNRIYHEWSQVTVETGSMLQRTDLISNGIVMKTDIIISSPSISHKLFMSSSFQTAIQLSSINELSSVEHLPSDSENLGPNTNIFSSSDLTSTLEWSSPTDSILIHSSILESVVDSTNTNLDSTATIDTTEFSEANSLSITESAIPSDIVSSELFPSFASSVPILSSTLDRTLFSSESSAESSTAVHSPSSLHSLSKTEELSYYSMDVSEVESSSIEPGSSSGVSIDGTLSSFVNPTNTSITHLPTLMPELEPSSFTPIVTASSTLQSTDSILPGSIFSSSFPTMSVEMTQVKSEIYSTDTIEDSFYESVSETFSFQSSSDGSMSTEYIVSTVISETTSTIDPISESLGFSESIRDISVFESSKDIFSSFENTISEIESEIVPSTNIISSSSDNLNSMTIEVPTASVITESTVTSTTSSSTTDTTTTMPNPVYPAESPNLDSILYVFSFELTILRNFSEIEESRKQEELLDDITDMLTQFVFVNIMAVFNVTFREGSIIATTEVTLGARVLNEVDLTITEAVTNITNNFLVNQEHIEDAIPHIDFNSSLDSLYYTDEQVRADPCSFITTERPCSPSYMFQCVDALRYFCEHRCVFAGNQCGENGVCFYDFTSNATACRCTTDSYRVYHGPNCEDSTATLSFVLAMSLGLGCGLMFICCLIIIALLSSRKRKERKEAGDLNTSNNRNKYLRDSTRSNEAYYHGEYIPTMTGDALSTFKYGPASGYSDLTYRESTPL